MQSFTPIKIPHGSTSKETAVNSVFGRDKLVDKLWASLKKKSIRVLSERRVGKTWMLHLAEAREPEWASCLFIDVEACKTIDEFVLLFNQELRNNNLIDENTFEKTAGWLRSQIRKLSNPDGKTPEGRILKTVKKLDSWDAFFVNSIDKWAKSCNGKKLVLMIDELPFLLDKIQKGNPDQAIELLDKLRWIRQNNLNVRMLFCGSLGLHIVLDKLHSNNYNGRPVNDMPPFEVPPLDKDDAITLAGGFLTSEELPCMDLEKVAESVANLTSCVPFYIDKLVTWMVDHPKDMWDAKSVEDSLYELFRAAGDPGEFAYYEGRISQYYKDSVKDKALVIMDILCADEKGLNQSDLFNLLRHNSKTLELDDSEYLSLLNLLRDDHYIHQDNDRWCFKISIVRKWWLDQRGSS